MSARFWTHSRGNSQDFYGTLMTMGHNKPDRHGARVVRETLSLVMTVPLRARNRPLLLASASIYLSQPPKATNPRHFAKHSKCVEIINYRKRYTSTTIRYIYFRTVSFVP